MTHKPSRNLLLVLAAVIRRLDVESLVDLRERFVSLGEHPAAVAVIDRQLARSKNLRRPGPQHP